MTTISCDVALVGCGPTGVVLANLLGQLGCRVVALERAAGVHAIPRATHIDEETQRNFQTTGLGDRLGPFMQPFGEVEFQNDRGRVVLRERIEDQTTEHGYRQSCFFDQPGFETVLREGLRRYPNVELFSSTEVESLRPTADGVVIEARRADVEQPLSIAARWAVGCDGGRSFVRDSLRIGMQSLADSIGWIVVDTQLNDPADAARLPSGFRYMLRSERMEIYAHGFGRNRRWEFQLAPGESSPDDAVVLRWLARHVDPDRLTILRIARYSHLSLVAEQWRSGRVLLSGDAAHMMPPTAGQGMCSGVRDALNLAWKLKLVVDGRASEELLDTYEQERRAHVGEVLQGALYLGRRLKANTAWQRWWRDVQLQSFAACRPLREMVRRRGVVHPPLRRGCLLEGARCVGEYLPQAASWNRGRRTLSDDQLGYRFALVARPDRLDKDDLDWAARRDLPVWRLSGAHGGAHGGAAGVAEGGDLVDADGALTRWFDARKIDFALVRPDRVVFAAGQRRELSAARERLERWIR